MQFFSRNCKMLALTLAVCIITAMLMPTTAEAQTRGPSVSYPEFSPKWEKYMEREYWSYTVAKAIDYTEGVDGLSKRDAVRIAAFLIHEEMDCYPASEPGDATAATWQRHWGNFFSRIVRGEFTDRELRRAFRTWRARQHHTRHRHRRKSHRR